MTGRGGRRPLSEVGPTLGKNARIFVCSSSYEDRCLSIPLQVSPDAIGHAVIVENIDIKEVRYNAERLTQHFGEDSKLIEANTGDPIESVKAMHAGLHPVIGKQEADRVAVDITTFTHEQLLILLGLLRRIGCKTVLCLYSGAAEYMTGEKRWLSEGIVDIRSVLGFSGDLGIRSGTQLVMLIGFEWERAKRLIEAYDPVQLALGIGRQEDSIEDEHYKTNKEFFEKLMAHYPHATRFEFSCNDAETTARIIAEQCQDETLTPVVAPLNTKISTVGAALAALNDDRIQLCYAQPAIYNCVSYSKPGEYFRSFRIRLASER